VVDGRVAGLIGRQDGGVQGHYILTRFNAIEFPEQFGIDPADLPEF
jgi:hypothetical protein